MQIQNLPGSFQKVEPKSNIVIVGKGSYNFLNGNPQNNIFFSIIKHPNYSKKFESRQESLL